MAQLLRELVAAQTKVEALERLVRPGKVALTAVGQQLLQEFIRAYRAGTFPPIHLIEPMMLMLVPTMRDASVVAYLTGMGFVYTSAPKESGISFSYKASLNQLHKRFLFTSEDTVLVADLYEAESLKILERASANQRNILSKSISEIVRSDVHVREGIKQIEGAFARAGIIPTNSYEAENLFRTQTQLASAAGQYAAEQDPAIQEILKGYLYVTVGDVRVRQNHANLHGLYLAKDDPAWETVAPPNGYSCRCQRIPIFDDREFSNAKTFDQQVIEEGADKGFAFHPGKIAPFQESHTYEQWLEKKASKGGSLKGRRMPLSFWQQKLTLYQSNAGRVVAHPLLATEQTVQRAVDSLELQADIHEVERRMGGTKLRFGVGSETFTVVEQRELVKLTKEALDEIENSGVKRFSKLGDGFLFRKNSLNRADTLNGQYRTNFNERKSSIHILYQRKGKRRDLRADLVLGTREGWTVEESVRGTIRHEVGHHLHNDAFVDGTVKGLAKQHEFRQEWHRIYETNRITELRGVSEYAKTNEREFFAESYSAWSSSQYASNEHKRLTVEVESFFIKHFGPHPNLKR